jgi:hypothetical protein
MLASNQRCFLRVELLCSGTSQPESSFLGNPGHTYPKVRIDLGPSTKDDRKHVHNYILKDHKSPQYS